VSSLQAADLFHRRRKALLDFDEGRIPQAEERLAALVGELAGAVDDAARIELCRTLLDHATVLRFSNRLDEALADLDAALRAAEALPLLHRRATLVNVHGLRARILASTAAHPEQAVDTRSALAELRKLASGWQADEIQSELAFRERVWDRAAELALAAARGLAAEGWTVPAATLRGRAGEAYLELGALEAAEAELRPAHDALANAGSPDRLARVRRALARLELAMRRPDAAWEHALAALDGVESLIRHFRVLADQRRFLADKLAYYDVAFDVGRARAGAEGTLRAWTIAERAKSFYLCQLVANADVPLYDGVDAVGAARLRAVEDELDTLERAAARGADADGLDELSREKQRLLDELMRQNPRWAGLRVPPPLDLAGEFERLGAAWTPLSYFWRDAEGGGSTLHIFVRPGSGEPRLLRSRWSRAEVSRLEKARDALRGRVPVPARLLPADLAAKLFPTELEPLVGDGRCLLVSPHDRLRALPLHAADAGRGWLPIDRWPFLYVPTLALLPLRRERPPARRVLLVGSPDNAFGDRTLGEVGPEIEAIRTAWSAARPRQVTIRIVDSDESPRAAGVGIDAWADCEYVHIACHGHFPEGRPLDTALRLGTDALRASELFATRLRARLVSLSACSLGRQEHSGNLAGDEWVGLYAPLFYAGAETLLVSVWDAYSREAAALMTTLHDRLAAGALAAEAFFGAVPAVRRKPLPLWANWYLAGVPGDKEG
jgi:CHAT domain